MVSATVEVAIEGELAAGEASTSSRETVGLTSIAISRRRVASSARIAEAGSSV